MDRKAMRYKQQHRALRGFVYFARAIGWVLIALAFLSVPQISTRVGLANGFKLLSSVVLGLLGIAWVVGLELILRFLDRYLLSRD
jgi:hypothetical protein